MLPKVKLLQKLTNCGIIAVMRGTPDDKIIPVADSLVEGGVTDIEVTIDNPGAYGSIGRYRYR